MAQNKAQDILLELDDKVIANLKLKAELANRSLEEQIVAMLTANAPAAEDREQDSSPSGENASS